MATVKTKMVQKAYIKACLKRCVEDIFVQSGG